MVFAMKATYELSHSYLRTAWGGIAFSTAMFAMSVVALSDIPFGPRLLVAAIVFPLIPLLFLSLSVYLLLAVKRHRLVITETHVESRGVWMTRRIALDDVFAARWRRWGGSGRLVMRAAVGRVAIDLDNYDAGVRRTLIRFFRFRLRHDIQQGWSTYWAVYWRLFDLPDTSDATTDVAEARARAAARTGSFSTASF